MCVFDVFTRSPRALRFTLASVSVPSFALYSNMRMRSCAVFFLLLFCGWLPTDGRERKKKKLKERPSRFPLGGRMLEGLGRAEDGAAAAAAAVSFSDSGRDRLPSAGPSFSYSKMRHAPVSANGYLALPSDSETDGDDGIAMRSDGARNRGHRGAGGGGGCCVSCRRCCRTACTSCGGYR